MKSRRYLFLTNFKVNIKVRNYFAIRNSGAEITPPKTKGDLAVIPYISKELNKLTRGPVFAVKSF